MVLPDSDEHPPAFTTTAPTRVNQGDTYSYPAHASDPDGDPLTYRLVSSPPSMTIDRDTGLVTWTPTAADLSTDPLVTLTADDGRGGIATQTFHVAVVRLINHPPKFTSTPVLTAASGLLYQYQSTAVDPDADPLTFDLPVHPDGMVVDPTTGLIFWAPGTDQGGPQNVLLRVQDGQGGVDTQSFQVVVNPFESAPVLTSTPPNTMPEVGLTWVYQVHAQDAEGDPLHYSLQNPPAGMMIDPTTGLISWTPATAGPASTTLVVDDGRGGVATQPIALTVVPLGPPRPPVITSTPRSVAQFSAPYLYQVVAVSPDASRLTYHLDAAPTGATLDPNSGLLVWTPTAAQSGSQGFTVRVTDGRTLPDGSIEGATQTFTVQVGDGVTNHPPTITSTAPTVAVLGRTYAYDAAATDPDHDPLSWSLAAGAPPGLSIDPRLGTLRWQPTPDDLGTHPVTIRVRDPLGAADSQTFTIDVRGTDSPPNITSTPVTLTMVGAPYSYAVAAEDPDGDPLTYRLGGTPPAGVTINPATGLLSWAVAAPVGSYPIAVIADDGLGGTCEQDYTLQVASAPDHPPTIVSTPVTFVVAGAGYASTVVATDPDNDPLTFRLTTASAWLAIDGKTGVISGTAPGDGGSYSVTVVADDGRGGTADQSFTILARVDHPPTITSAAVSAATAGAPYLDEVMATDPDGDAITYSVTATPAAAGLAIDAQGRVTWLPTAADIGQTRQVTVTATDPFGEATTQTYDLAIVPDTTSPTVVVQTDASNYNLGDTVNLLVSASDNVGVATLGLTVGGQVVHLDANGAATLKATGAGSFTVGATATDPAGNLGTATTTYRVVNPDARAPIVAIASPTSGASLETPTAVIGSVSAPDGDLLGYTLAIAPAGSDTFTTLTTSTSSTPVANATLGQVDPTLLADGSYVIRLTADTAGGQEASTETTVTVAGTLKLGDFKLSFADLSIPVAGIPITVTRSYDTINANQSGDFGYGWSIGVGDVSLTVDSPPGAFTGSGQYPAFVDGTRVTVTLPGQKPQGYTFKPLPETLFGAILDYHPYFAPDPTDTDTLSGPDASLTRFDDGTYVNSDADLTPYNPADPVFGGGYTLQAFRGATYQIDPNAGKITSIADRNGNTLDFSDSGIVSSTGVSVSFVRDFRDRITSIIDPAGHAINYAYDAFGNLASVTDRRGQVTTIVYRTDRAHYVDHVVGPSGAITQQVVYDAQGRVAEIAGPNGSSTSSSYNLGALVQTTTDALGNTTRTAFDAAGNVTAVLDAAGGSPGNPSTPRAGS